MPTVWRAETEATFDYECSACGFRGVGTARGANTEGGGSREAALESAHAAARDAVLIAACPNCGARNAEENARVRNEALAQAGMFAALGFFPMLLYGFMRERHFGGFLVGGVVVGVLLFCVVFFVRWGGRVRAAASAEIRPAEPPPPDAPTPGAPRKASWP